METSRLRPIDLPLAPSELAGRLSNLPGFVFLDSALEEGNSVSIIAFEPERILEGDIRNGDELRRILDEHRIEDGDTGMPAGAAIGWIQFDGRFRFGIYPHLLVYAHPTGVWWSSHPNPLPDFSASPPATKPTVRFTPEISRDHFLTMVGRAREYIAAGDIYQACLAHRFFSPWSGEPWALYSALRDHSPAPQAAFARLGGTTILSASPETFLQISGREIVTRPIKGTRPRRPDPDADERSAYDLLTSPKEIAELVMITDLERNDLGRVCEFGSVRVSDLLRLERYEQVFHLVSTVRGTLRPDVSHLEAIAACFPGGSISGAPKKRALEIISELEPAPRGIYTGAIGYLGFNGESRFNIAIRTVVIENSTASFHVGAGIVADSVPEMEWQETLDKAAGILLAAERMNATVPSPRARQEARRG